MSPKSLKEVMDPVLLKDEIEKLLVEDQGLRARERLRECAREGVNVPPELVERVDEWLAHIDDPDRYVEFYTSHREHFRSAGDMVVIHDVISRLGRVRELMEKNPPKTILDLGCFDGFALHNLCLRFQAEGVGVDLDGVAIRHAEAVRDELKTKTTFIHSRIEELYERDEVKSSALKANSFDAVLLGEILEHVPHVGEVIEVAEYFLAPGGRIYITTPASPVPHLGNEHEAREHVRCFGIMGVVDALDERVIEVHEFEDNGSHKEQIVVYRRPRLTVWTNHVYGGWDPRDPKSYGGSEEGVVNLARTLARRGYEVEVYYNAPEGTTASHDDESGYLGYWYDRESFDPAAERDLFVSVKDLEVFDQRISARRKYLWTADAHRPGDLTPGRASQLDKIIAISPYHKAEIERLNPYLAPGSVDDFPYGLNGEYYTGMAAVAAEVERDPHSLMYASSLDRGLELLLDAWPRIREEVPEAKLSVWYGFDLSDKIAGASQDYQMWKARMVSKLDQPGITLEQRTDIDDVKPYLEAAIWAYPCIGGERFCITAIKAQKLGTVPVVIPTMALQTTVKHGLRADDPVQFVDALIGLMKDEEKQKRIRAEMIADPEILTWDGVVDRYWTRLWGKHLKHDARNLKVKLGEPSEPRPTLSEQQRTGLDIYMLTDGMPHNGDTLESENSLGGSETASISMARALSRLGHHVTVFCNTDKPGKYDGVRYSTLDEYNKLGPGCRHDVSIIQRVPGYVGRPIASKLNWMWMHDLALGRTADNLNVVTWNVDKIVTVSEWHRDQYREVHPEIPESLFLASRNGIELDKFPPFDIEKKERKHLLYAARPERGLDRLLDEILPRLLAEDPEIKLSICTYAGEAEQMKAYYERLRAKAASFGDRCSWLGPLSKSDLYELHSRIGVYVYPTPGHESPKFREVSCITAMECMASGTPIVSTDVGALPETIQDAGILVQKHTEPDYVERFCNSVLEVIRDDAVWNGLSERGRARASALGWDDVAKAWTEEMYTQLAERNDDPRRLALHFMKRSDIVAAREAVLDVKDPTENARLTNMITARWGHALAGNESRDYYDEAGKKQSVSADDYRREWGSGRVQYVINFLREHPEIKRVLDVGCAHGAFGLAITNNVEGVEYVGVDISSEFVQRARASANNDDICKRPDAVRFYTDKEFAAQDRGRDFGLLMSFDTLEHVPEPWSLVEQYERHLAPEGFGLFCVPFGPWEYSSWAAHDIGAHIWEFDLHDLREMFEAKKDMGLMTMRNGSCPELEEPIGWTFVTYQANDAPVGKINMKRKLAVQAPRQLCSAVIIAGRDPDQPPPEDTLHWCLRSMQHVIDELIVVNCGDSLSNEAIRIIEQHAGYFYKPRIISGSEPKQFGFETPRNEGLHAATGDWILWIDTDERLMGSQHIRKYLRQSLFDGHNIAQHHFSCDGQFTPDQPVRLFRKIGNDGRGIRWFGMIHEHPEKKLNEGPGPTIGLSDVHVAHVGYLKEEIRKARFFRNNPLLGLDVAKYPKRNIQKYFLTRDWMLEVNHILSQTGGVPNDRVKQLCLMVVEVWRKHLRCAPTQYSSDPIEWYNAANDVLAQMGVAPGVVVKWGFESSKGVLNGGAPPLKMVRFATIEDAEIEIAHRLKESLQPHKQEWW